MPTENPNNYTSYAITINGLIIQTDTNQYPDLTDQQMIDIVTPAVAAFGASSCGLFKETFTGTVTPSQADLNADPPVFT